MTSMLNEPKVRARVVTIFFAFAFIFFSPLPVEVFIHPGLAEFMYTIPFYIFLVLLLVHTYHAVHCFKTVAPKQQRMAHVIDAILVLLYLALPMSLWYGSFFYLIATLLFAVASLKYALLFGQTSAGALVRKKLIVDIIGILGCLIAFIGDALGFWPVTDWIFAIGFAAVTIYLFYIDPLYVLPREHGQPERRPS